MQTATASLIVAICGLVLACLSLGWQTANYVLTGGRVKVLLRVGAMNSRGMVTAPPDGLDPDWLTELAAKGYPRPIVAVRVANVGRQPVVVERWGLQHSVGASLYPVGDSIGKPLPHRLEVGESETWAIDLGSVVDLLHAGNAVEAKRPRPSTVIGQTVAASKQSGIIRASVELADGRTKRSPEVFR